MRYLTHVKQEKLLTLLSQQSVILSNERPLEGSQMNKITIDVVAHHQDNGDGSTTVSLYNNEQELAEVLKIAGFKYTVDDIKDGEDPYYTGTLAKARINLILDDNGHLRLDGPLNLTSDD